MRDRFAHPRRPDRRKRDHNRRSQPPGHTGTTLPGGQGHEPDRSDQTEHARARQGLDSVQPESSGHPPTASRIEPAEDEEIWDTGWPADQSPEVIGRDSRPARNATLRRPDYPIVTNSLGTLAWFATPHGPGGRPSWIQPLLRRRPAAIAMLVVFVLCFLLTCVAPLVPLLRLGYDVADASRRVSVLKELLAGDPTRLMNAETLQTAQLQVDGIRSDLYEINGAMNIVSAPWAKTSVTVQNYRLLVRIGLDLTTAAGDGLRVAESILKPVQGGLITSSAEASGITQGDIEQAHELLAHARSYLVDASRAFHQLDQSSLPGLFKPPASIGNMLVMIPDAVSAIDEINSLLDVAPAVLGVGQPAYYLVVAMDSTELRPGGGFIGNYGILGLQGGRQIRDMPLSLRNTYLLDQQYYQNALEPYRILQGVPSVTDVKGCESLGPQPPAYYWWWPYRGFDTTCTYGWGLRDANLSPSFPDNARAMMQITEAVNGAVPNGAPLQGVIAFTPGLIKDLLKITGPIVVPQFNVKVSAENLEGAIHTYQLTDAKPKEGDRKAFTHLLSSAMLDKLKTLHGDKLKAVVQAAHDALKSKDLQVYFSDPRAELMLRQLGLAADLSTSGDGFMVVDANDGGNKANTYVTEQQTDVVTLLPDGGALHHLQTVVTYDKGLRTVYPGTTRQDDYSDFQRTYLPGNATILGMAGYNPNMFTPFGCDGSGINGYGTIISDCSPGNAIINPVTTSDVPGRTMVGGALLVLCGQYDTFINTSREYASCEAHPKPHSQTIYISWYTPNAFTPRPDGHGSYTEMVQHQAGNKQRLTVYVDTSQLHSPQPAGADAVSDPVIAASTPTARDSAFAALLGQARRVFNGPLDQDQTVTFNF